MAALRGLGARHFVLDGEIAIQREGALSFDDLLMRIAAARKWLRSGGGALDGVVAKRRSSRKNWRS